MSAIAGVWWRTPRRVGDDPSDLVHRMLDRMADRGGDRRDVRSAEGCCLGASVRWTTPGATRDHQPVVLTDPPFWLVLDGRLDNRDEVAARLGAPAASPDADLMARWLARREADPGALIGDFSLATWDPRAHCLRLMRDAIGVRPLYYAETPDVIWFASSLAAMVLPEWYRREPNEGYIAEFLADGRASLDETPFAGIRRLPQAHVLEVTAASVHRRAYWTLDIREERSITEPDAIEEFRSVFETSVRARLRARAPVAFQLSGGLDSSTVVGVAHALGVASPATYSLVYPEVPAADESEFIDAVVRHTGARSVRWPLRPFPVQGFDVFAGASRTGDMADIATGQFALTPLLRRARADGHEVMLTGCGGDEWLTGSLFRVPALIRRGRWLAAWRYAAEYRGIHWLDPGARTLLRTAVAALLPASVKTVLRALRPAPPLPGWITPALTRRTNLEARLRASFDRVPGDRNLVVRESLVRLTSGEGAFVREALDRMGAGADVELRHPFFDRRVVEFLIGLPDHLRFHQGTHRYLVRRTFADVLPERVRTRLGKPNFDHVVTDALRAVDPERWLDTLEVVQRGWVRADAARDLWRRTDRAARTQHVDDLSAAMLLWNIFAVEAWLRAVFSTSDHVAAAGRTSPVSF